VAQLPGLAPFIGAPAGDAQGKVDRPLR